MKKAIKTRYLPPREKQYPASLMDIGLQRWCNDMWLKLVIVKAKLHTHTRNNKVNFAAGEREGALGYYEWRMAA